MATAASALVSSKLSSPAAAVRVPGRLAQAWKAWRNRGACRRLSEMPDASLADIGLTRADLRAAAGLPLTVDPTAHLAAVARSRLRSGVSA